MITKGNNTKVQNEVIAQTITDETAKRLKLARLFPKQEIKENSDYYTYFRQNINLDEAIKKGLLGEAKDIAPGASLQELNIRKPVTDTISIDTVGGVLNVNKDITSKIAGAGDIIQPVKNDYSIRKVIMPKDVIEMLLNRVKGYNPDDFIFGKEKAFRESNLRRSLNKHIKIANVKHIVMYSFRHSHATHLIRSGVPIKVVSQRLGHKDVSTTINTYWHLLKDDEKQALEALNSTKK